MGVNNLYLKQLHVISKKNIFQLQKILATVWGNQFCHS